MGRKVDVRARLGIRDSHELSRQRRHGKQEHAAADRQVLEGEADVQGSLTGKRHGQPTFSFTGLV